VLLNRAVHFVHVFHCKVKDYCLLIKFEPTGEFNLKNSYSYSVERYLIKVKLWYYYFFTNVHDNSIMSFMFKI
jgi:hypothetical protein